MIQTIKGGSHTDQRGTVAFFNDFDMSAVKRFYTIENANTSLVRAWRAHRIEQRWFYAAKGAFLLHFVKIDNWDSPSKTLPIEAFEISAQQHEILHMPSGYASSVRALTPEAKLIVFGDYGIDHAKNDDYLYPADYFLNN